MIWVFITPEDFTKLEFKMADDLDDLLDEVESKFCKDSPAKKPAKSKSPGSVNFDSKQQGATSTRYTSDLFEYTSIFKGDLS
jgi:hypothetical protein